MERRLLFSAGTERGTQKAHASRTVPSLYESRGLFKARARSQESVMRNKGDRILISSSCIVSKTVSHKLESVTQ